VRDTSLRLPPGVSGTIVDVRVFNRHGIDIDDRTRAIQTEEKERLRKDANDEKGILNRATFARLQEMLVKQVATAVPKGVKKGETLTADLLDEGLRALRRREEADLDRPELASDEARLGRPHHPDRNRSA